MEQNMDDFPEFIKSPDKKEDQYSDDIEGYVFPGKDKTQITYRTCRQDTETAEHTHEFDEYFTVVQGEFTLCMDGKAVKFGKGDECMIPKGKLHSGKAKAGTRTIHFYGNKP